MYWCNYTYIHVSMYNTVYVSGYMSHIMPTVLPFIF